MLIFLIVTELRTKYPDVCHDSPPPSPASDDGDQHPWASVPLSGEPLPSPSASSFSISPCSSPPPTPSSLVLQPTLPALPGPRLPFPILQPPASPSCDFPSPTTLASAPGKLRTDCIYHCFVAVFRALPLGAVVHEMIAVCPIAGKVAPLPLLPSPSSLLPACDDAFACAVASVQVTAALKETEGHDTHHKPLSRSCSCSTVGVFSGAGKLPHSSVPLVRSGSAKGVVDSLAETVALPPPRERPHLTLEEAPAYFLVHGGLTREPLDIEHLNVIDRDQDPPDVGYRGLQTPDQVCALSYGYRVSTHFSDAPDPVALVRSMRETWCPLKYTLARHSFWSGRHSGLHGEESLAARHHPFT